MGQGSLKALEAKKGVPLAPRVEEKGFLFVGEEGIGHGAIIRGEPLKSRSWQGE